MTKYLIISLILSFSVDYQPEVSLFSRNELTDLSHQSTFSPPLFEASASEKVKKKLQSMTLREKIAQMIISSTIPENFSENSAEFRKLSRLCTETKVGGFIFFKGSCSDYARLSNKLQELSETPLLISADFERGTGMRVTDGNLFPNNMAIGATGNTDLAYKMGVQIAYESRLLGVRQDYAPDCDVNNNPNNPIINVRSFGEDPELVSKMSEAEIRGLQDGKVIATAKHFPGHGDTEIDSHSDLPILNFDIDRLNRIELVPFKNAVSKNVMSVMAAHLSFPLLENRDHIPASLSSQIINGLLIDKLGFKGLVVTDALNMKGITKYFTTSEVAVMCVNAGIDLILMPLDEEKSISAIESAVNKGSITEDRINASVEKILKAKEWAGLFENRYVNADNVYSQVHNGNAEKLAQLIADESITIVKDDNKSVPFKKQNPKVQVFCISDGTDNINSDHFKSAVQFQYPNAVFTDINSGVITADANSSIDDAGNYDLVLVGIFAKIKFGTGRISILPAHIDALNRITRNNNHAILLSFGNPYLLKEFPDVPSYICAYGDADVSIDAALKVINGSIKPKGKLPVSINEAYKYGSGITY